MFRIKICGVTNRADAAASVAAGADALGFNFYPNSPRYVAPQAAAAIAAELPNEVARVGVFVNETAEKIQSIARSVGLDYLQLHGDEPPEFCESLFLPIIRAFRCRDASLQPVADYLARCKTRPVAVLLDAFAPNQFGGTGHRVDWQTVAREAAVAGRAKIILAGGLTPENVAEAIAVSRAFAVDTASGVEAAPGVKDAAKVRAFVDAARQAFALRGADF